jgi:hypothetical protein
MGLKKTETVLTDLLVSAYKGITLDTPIDVCPECYESRDRAIPLWHIGGSHAYFRHPITKERLRECTPAGVTLCFSCGWTQPEEPR